MSAGQGIRQQHSDDERHLDDKESPTIRRRQHTISNRHTVTHKLAISSMKIEFLRERSSARKSLIKLLNEKGFKVSFDFELLKIKIETEVDRDVNEVLQFIEDHVVEMDLPISIEIPNFETLQGDILENDGFEVMFQPDKHRRSLKVVGLYEGMQAVKHNIHTQNVFERRPLMTPLQTEERRANTRAEDIVNEGNGNLGACGVSEERGNSSIAEEEILCDRVAIPECKRESGSNTEGDSASSAHSEVLQGVMTLRNLHCQNVTQTSDVGSKQKCSEHCASKKPSLTVVAGKIPNTEEPDNVNRMCEVQGDEFKVSDDERHFDDNQSPIIGRRQHTISNRHTVTRTLAISSMKIEFLRERSNARKSLIKLLNKKGFKVSFDFKLLKIKIETEVDKDVNEALQFIEDHVVEMDFPMSIELPDVETLQGDILENDEVMFQPDKHRRSLKVVGFYESMQTVKHSINTKHVFEGRSLMRPLQTEEGRAHTKAEEDIVNEGNDWKHSDLGVVSEERGRSSKAEEEISYERIAIPNCKGERGRNIAEEILYERGDVPDSNSSAQSNVLPNGMMPRTQDCGDGAMSDDTQPSDVGSKEGGSVRCAQNKPSLTVLADRIQNNETGADVIVNSTNLMLDLTLGGGVSSAILRAAGESIKNDLKDKYPKGIHKGEVAKSGPGNINACRAIYHGVLPMFRRDKSGQEGTTCYKALVTVVLNTLLMASSEGFSSVAFPALGTGNLEYPIQDVVQLMFLAVSHFFDCAMSSVRKILFVIYPQTVPRVKQMFLMEFFSCQFRTVKVASSAAAQEELEGNPAQMCEARFEKGKRFLQISTGNVKTVCDYGNVVLILWSPDHLERKKHPIVSCFGETVQQKIYSDKVHLLKQKDTKFVLDTESFMNTCLIHLYCKDDTDDVIVRAIARGIKHVVDDMNTIVIPVKSDGSRTWQPHAAAKIIAKALQNQDRTTLPHVIRVIIHDSNNLVSFLTSMQETCKIQQVENVTRVFDTFLSSESRASIYDRVLTPRTETPTIMITEIAEKLERRFGVTLMRPTTDL